MVLWKQEEGQVFYWDLHVLIRRQSPCRTILKQRGEDNNEDNCMRHQDQDQDQEPVYHSKEDDRDLEDILLDLPRDLVRF